MKKPIAIFTVISLAASFMIPAPSVAAEVDTSSVSSIRNSLNLVWADEFDGNSIDHTKWKYEGSKVHRNGESQVYADTDEEHNAWIGKTDKNFTSQCVGTSEKSPTAMYTEYAEGAEDGSALIIEARKQNRNGYRYTSACLRGDNYEINGKNENQHNYFAGGGMFEARLKFPTGQGLWSAFWMKGKNTDINGPDWPVTGEIDIMENMGSLGNCDYITSCCIHYSPKRLTSNHAEKFKHQTNPWPLRDTWHTYGVYYDAEQLIYYFDNQIVGTHDISADEYYFFREFPTFMLLNFALEGIGGSGLSGEKPLPDDFVNAQYAVDYVRVYQENGTPITPPVKPKTLGDINNDGDINTFDLQMLLNMVTTGKSGDLDVCDLDSNKSVDIIDIQLLLNKVLS